MLLFGVNPFLEARVIPNISSGHIRYFTFRDMHELLIENNFLEVELTSDCVNLSASGELAIPHPTLLKKYGRCIIATAKKMK